MNRFSSTHLTFEQIYSLLQGAAPPKDRAALLEHALACEACAGLLYEASAALPAAAPPVGMEDRILEAVEREAVQRENARHEPTKRQGENLRTFSLRVFAAMAAALILLFSGAFRQLGQLPQKLPEIQQSLRTQINEFIDFTKEGLHIASESQ